MNCLINFFFYSYRIYTIITQICTHIFLPGEYGAAVILSLVDLSLDYWDSGDLSMRFFMVLIFHKLRIPIYLSTGENRKLVNCLVNLCPLQKFYRIMQILSHPMHAYISH